MFNKLLILSLLISFFLLGCSSNSKDPIAPIVPENSEWHNATSMSGGTVTDDSYWNENLIVRDKLWLAHRNENGSIHYALGPGIDASSDPLDIISEFGNIFLLPADNFQISSDENHAGLRIVMLRQYYKNLRVWPSMIQVVYGRHGKFLKAMADVFPISNLNTAPVLSASDAIDTTLIETGESEIEIIDLVIFATQETSNLAYRVKTYEWIFYIDALDGSVLDSEHLQWDAFEGNVTGYASVVNPHDPEEIFDFSNVEMRIRVDAAEAYPTSYMPITNIDGFYSFEAPESQLEAELRLFGPWLNVNNNVGFPYNEVSVKINIADNQPMNWLLDDSNSFRDERTVWYWSNHAWDYMKDVDPTGDEMDWRLIGHVRKSAWCNANANSNSVNYYLQSGSCINLGHIPDVVVHEWGHVHMYGQFGSDLPDSFMREGNSDIIANTVCGHPYIGYGVQGEGTYFRLSDNELQWPLDECGGQAHCLGRLIAGAFWDLEELVGEDYHDYLWHFSKYLLPQNYQSWGADVVITDDDDDNPLNGSPNFDAIFESWETNHNLDIPDATDTPTEGVIIDTVPHFPEIRIPEDATGKNFSYNLKIMNLDDAPTNVSVWAAVELPWSAMYGPIIPPNYTWSGPLNVPLDALQIMEFDPVQTLPDFVPVGEYVYHVRTGEFVDNVNDILNDDAWFSFWVY